MSEQKFEEWALVELFGHQRLAGKVSEQTIGGCSFVRVDVPATTSEPAHTRLFGNGAIYSINPTTEETAKALAERFKVVPVMAYEVEEHFRQYALSYSGEEPDFGRFTTHNPDGEM